MVRAMVDPSVTDIAARAVTYPGTLLKAIPSFVFTPPLGWVLDEAPGALAVVRLPREVDGFWVNAILSTDRVGRTADFQSVAKATFAATERTAKDLTRIDEKLVRFGSLVMYLRAAEFTADARRLGQIHAIFFAPVTEGGKTVDMFQFVLTGPAGAMDGITGPFTEMLSTFRFT